MDKVPLDSLDSRELSETRIAAQTDIYHLFRNRTVAMPTAIAIEDAEKQVSYAQLLDRVDRLAGHFAHLGLSTGDRIAILSRNRSEYIEVELAAAAAGLIVACLNWRLLPTELHHCITLVSPRLIITEADLSPLLEQMMPDIPRLPFGPAYENALTHAPQFRAIPQDPEQGLVILYTSGTTGLPKGAVISHRALPRN